jgi:hypothetical protein
MTFEQRNINMTYSAALSKQSNRMKQQLKRNTMIKGKRFPKQINLVKHITLSMLTTVNQLT